MEGRARAGPLVGGGEVGRSEGSRRRPGGRGYAFALVLAGSVASARAFYECDQRSCSGHGLCEAKAGIYSSRRRCVCHDGWFGVDCRFRSCPKGPAWTGYSWGTDSLHTQQEECSGKGVCNRGTGVCRCEVGFFGEACQFLACPGNVPPGPTACSGNGACISLREAGERNDGFRFLRSFQYETAWDAERVFGCACEEAWDGYDCSTRSCPRGADPVTVAANSLTPEVVTLSCTCPGTCAGYLTLRVRGVWTDAIAANAVASVSQESSATATGTGAGESVEAKIEGTAIRKLLRGVAFSGAGSSVCSAAGQTTTITFRSALGDVPDLEVSYEATLTSNGVSTSGGAAGIIVSVATTSTTAIVAEECSGRGTCDSAGGCTCMLGFLPSNGDGASGSTADCGYISPSHTVTSCPTTIPLATCSGHGSCSGAPLYRCACFQGWGGAACHERECPSGKAWFDEPSGPEIAHAFAPCSNRGTCNRATGQCACMPGFSGSACERMRCPERLGQECSGRGRCLSNRELATLGRQRGDYASKGKNEVQTLTCTLTSGTFQLTFRHSTTGNIAFDASAAVVRQSLEGLSTVRFVSVTFDTGSVACSAAGVAIRVEFTHDYGDLPAIEHNAGAAITVVETQRGTRVSYGQSASKMETWDADMIFGCHCDGYPSYNHTSDSGDSGRYSGTICETRRCMTGSDPWTATPLQYTFQCQADGGSFVLSFSGEATDAIPFGASAATLKSMLEELNTIESAIVEVDTAGGTTCGAGAAGSVRLWLYSEVTDCDLVDLAVASSTLTLTAGVATSTVTKLAGSVDVEMQTLTCTADGGSAVLRFRGHSTASIPFNANEDTVRAALEALPSIGVVAVDVPGTSFCSAAGVATTVVFATELGDVESIQFLADLSSLSLTASTATLTVAETRKGTTTEIECSGRGVCNEDSGVCECFPTYVSGNGRGGLGRRGDCGALDAQFYQVRPANYLVDKVL